MEGLYREVPKELKESSSEKVHHSGHKIVN